MMDSAYYLTVGVKLISGISSPLSCAVNNDEESVCLSFPNVVPPSFASVAVVPAPGSVATIWKIVIIISQQDTMKF